MLKTAILAAAFACLPVAAHAAECLTIVGFVEFLEGNEKGAAIIEIVPVKTQSIDHLVFFRAENGNVLFMPEVKGCMFGQPVLVDVARQEEGA